MWAICADTDEEAERLASSSAMSFALLHQGKLIAVPPVDVALRFLAEAHAHENAALPVLPRARRKIVGAPETVRAGIESVAREYQADEVMVVTITYDHEARRRSYELIAQTLLRSSPRRRSSRPLETHPAE